MTTKNVAVNTQQEELGRRFLAENYDTDSTPDLDKAQKEFGIITDEKAKNAISLYSALINISKRAGATGTDAVTNAGYVTYAYLKAKNDEIIRGEKALDMTAIYEQVAQFINTDARNDENHYRIEMDNGATFTGTAGDIARWYCLQENIRLYISPVEENQTDLRVAAQFKGTEFLTHIAYFEKEMSTDIETAYCLFFKEYLQDSENSNFKIVEL